jgi:CubicO group peptidase (beta-lactamase class C family)
MTRKFLATVSWVLMMLSPFMVAAGEADPDWRGELESFFARAADALQVPGAVVVVATGESDPVILTHGVRCIGEADPVTAQTSFSLASLTKAFTATTAAVLVGEGTLQWDTRVRALVPELELSDPVAAERVTLRDLLANRSGLGEHSILWINVDAGPGWVVPRLAALEPAGELRDRFAYSGLGFILAGEAIARAAGAPWGEVVAQRLLGPLGMTSTTVGPPAGDAQTSCGHVKDAGSVRVLDPIELGVGAPAMGLYSTAVDVARWLELLLGRGTVDGKLIVDEKALAETWTPQTAVRSSRGEVRAYGLGWYVSTWRGRRQLFHGGGGVGFTSVARLFPEDDVAIAVLANTAVTALPDILAERAAELTLDEPGRRDLLATAEAMTARIEAMRAAAAAALRSAMDPDAPPTLETAAYAGCYENVPFGELEVRATSDGIGSFFHGIELTVEHLHDDVFLLSSPYTGDLTATFTVREGSAVSVSLPMGSPQAQRVFTRRAGACGGPSEDVGKVALQPYLEGKDM